MASVEFMGRHGREPDMSSAGGTVKASVRVNQLLARGVTPILVTTFAVVLILIWQAVTQLNVLPAYLLPTPAETAWAIWQDFVSPRFWTQQFLQTLIEVIVGFGIATVVGLVFAPLLLIHPLVERTVYPFVVAIQTMPKIAMAPLLLVWLGYGNTSKFVITALVAFFPVVVNTIAGLKAEDEEQLTLMRSLRASWWTQMKRVRIPNAMPYIFAGLDVAVVFAVIGAIVAEFLGSARGLGSLVIIRQTNIDVAGLFSVLFYLALMGFALHFIVASLGRRYTFWAQSSNK